MLLVDKGNRKYYETRKEKSKVLPDEKPTISACGWRLLLEENSWKGDTLLGQRLCVECFLPFPVSRISFPLPIRCIFLIQMDKNCLSNTFCWPSQPKRSDSTRSAQYQTVPQFLLQLPLSQHPLPLSHAQLLLWAFRNSNLLFSLIPLQPPLHPLLSLR